MRTYSAVGRSLKTRIREDIRQNRERVKKLGPGFITGGAGDDPAGIVTYSVVGASTGYSQLWLLLLSTPMMIAIQNMAARIAIITGKSLPEITTAFYSRKLTILMVSTLALANILTIGADLNAIAAILEIITGFEAVYLLIAITALIAWLIIFGRYRTIKRVLIGLTAILVVYIISAILARPSLLQVLSNTLIPKLHIDNAWIVAALGMLGTTISPYLMFWQASEEREEKKSVVQADEVGIDTVVGMIWSNLLAYAMIITGAAVLHGSGHDLQDVSILARTLRPVAGEYAFALFALGIIVSGLLAVPVLAGSTAYAVADTFGWREGMDTRVSDAKGFYIVFVGAMFVGAATNMAPDISVVDALYYSQVLDGMLIPVLIAIGLLISNNRAVMGDFTASRFENIFALFALLVTLALTGVMFWTWFA